MKHPAPRRAVWIALSAAFVFARPGFAETGSAALPAGAPPPAGANVPPPADADTLRELLVLVGKDAARLEGMRNRVSCRVHAHVDKLDGKGAVDSHTEIELAVVGDGQKLDSRIVRMVEDGEDKTAEAQRKQAEEKAKRDKEKDKKKKLELTLPFLPAEQGHYAFRLAEVDPASADRVRITFAPKESGENRYAGEAWIDRRSGTLLTMGLKPTKLPPFLFWMNVKLVFGAQTSAGPSLSRAEAEGEGGFLFIRKRFRMGATIGDYAIKP